MLPFNQGALDSLCGIYSVVNADRILNMTPKEGSKELFSEIIHFLSRKRWLSSILTEGMMLSLVGVACGLLIGYWAINLLVSTLLPLSPVPIVFDGRRDARVLGAMLVFCVIRMKSVMAGE